MQNMVQKDTHNFFNHFVRGAVHYSVGGTLAKILVFLNVALILSIVDPYQYGVYKLAFSVFITINGLLLSGINGLVLNDVIHYRTTGEVSKAGRLFYEFSVIKLVLGILALIFFYFGAGVIGLHYSEGIAFYLRILSVLFFTDALLTIIDVFFKTRLDFFGSNVIPLSNEIAKFFILSFFAFVSVDGLDIASLCIASTGGSIFSLLIILAYVYVKYTPKISIPRFTTHEIMMFNLFKTYGKWAIAKNYISTFVDNTRLWLVKLFISTEAVAIFSVAMSLVTTLKKFIPTQSISSLIPAYVKSPETLRDIYMYVTKYFIWIFSLTILISIIFVPLVVPFVFPKYVESLPYFKIIIFSIVFSGMILNKQIIYSLRKQRFLFILPIIEVISTLLFGLLLIPRFGLYGTTLELLITEGILFIVIYRFLLHIQPELHFVWYKLIVFDAQDLMIAKQLWQKISKKLKLTT